MTMETGRHKVLIIIDVQNEFIDHETERVVQFIARLLDDEHWDFVIQSRWENCSGSQYETRLGYHAGHSGQSEPFFDPPGGYIFSRATYSCANDELLKLISKDDDIYVTGLETDACVMATLFDLWDLGYSFHVYEKGVGTTAGDLQEPAIRMIRRQFGKNTVISNDLRSQTSLNRQS